MNFPRAQAAQFRPFVIGPNTSACPCRTLPPEGGRQASRQPGIGMGQSAADVLSARNSRQPVGVSVLNGLKLTCRKALC